MDNMQNVWTTLPDEIFYKILETESSIKFLIGIRLVSTTTASKYKRYADALSKDVPTSVFGMLATYRSLILGVEPLDFGQIYSSFYNQCYKFCTERGFAELNCHQLYDLLSCKDILSAVSDGMTDDQKATFKHHLVCTFRYLNRFHVRRSSLPTLEEAIKV